MNRIFWWLTDIACRILEPAEREAVQGDLAESGESGAPALVDVLGLAARRQAALWQDWRPWFALLAAAPLAVALQAISSGMAHVSAIYLWMYLENWDWRMADPRNVPFWQLLAPYAAVALLWSFALICWSWSAGVALGSLARRAVAIHGLLFGPMLLLAGFATVPPYRRNGNELVFSQTFYSAVLPWIVLVILVGLPSFWGMRQSSRLARLPLLPHTLVWAAILASLIPLAGHGLIERGAVALALAPAGPIAYITVIASRRRRLSRRSNHETLFSN